MLVPHSLIWSWLNLLKCFFRGSIFWTVLFCVSARLSRKLISSLWRCFMWPPAVNHNALFCLLPYLLKSCTGTAIHLIHNGCTQKNYSQHKKVWQIKSKIRSSLASFSSQWQFRSLTFSWKKTNSPFGEKLRQGDSKGAELTQLVLKMYHCFKNIRVCLHFFVRVLLWQEYASQWNEKCAYHVRCCFVCSQKENLHSESPP